MDHSELRGNDIAANLLVILGATRLGWSWELDQIPFYVWIVIGGAVIHGAAYVVVGTLWVSSLKNSVIESFRTEMKNERVEIDHAIATLENEVRQSVLGLQNDSRQSVASLHNILGSEINGFRTALHEHEKFTRDTFVRRESFQIIIDQFITQIKELSSGINKRLDRFDDKLDHLTGGNRPG